VHVIDSRSACGGQRDQALSAAAAARSGADASAVVDRARQAREKLDLWFAIETLEYLRRGGRIGGAQAWLGSALQIKPILTVEGEITPIERVRTSRRAFERMAALLEECARHGNDAWMVQHIQSPEEADRLAERGKEIFGTDPINFSEIGPVIGTHVGPGLLGVGGIPSSLLQ
jgi:DegV family protein with EDD domain